MLGECAGGRNGSASITKSAMLNWAKCKLGVLTGRSRNGEPDGVAAASDMVEVKLFLQLEASLVISTPLGTRKFAGCCTALS